MAFDRREFLRTGAISAAGVTAGAAGASAAEEPVAFAPPTKYPKLAFITTYSPQKLAFATQAGYEGVVLTPSEAFNPDRLSDSDIDAVLAAARNAGCRIISLDMMWGYNHIDADAGRRRTQQQRFIRVLELAHRLGCKFVGTFSGAQAGATMERQAAELATAFNDVYLPVCDKLDLSMGWENYPCDANFATVPAAWEAVFRQVPSPRLGLEFDPSHLVRQDIDPLAAAWDFKERIRAAHAKDTEIIKPVLQRVGIHGQGWWRYRIPGQGLVNWAGFITVLLQAHFAGGLAVEHEDAFWDAPVPKNDPEFPQERKDGFILARRYLGQFLPARLT